MRDTAELIQAFEYARQKVHDCKKPGKFTNNLERTYGRAYKELVKAGLRPKIKQKYQRGT